MAIKKIDNFNIHENPATNTDQFDVENYLNENWRKIKDVVNNNADELQNLQTDNTQNIQDITDIKSKQTEQNKKLESIEEKNTSQDAELEKLKEENKALKSQIPSGEVEGQTIHIEDSSDLEANVSVKGNYYQETSEQGSNSFDSSIYEDIEKDGVTIKRNNDGTITLNGTYTGESNWTYQFTPKKIIKNSEELLLMKKISGDMTGQLRFTVWEDNHENKWVSFDNTNYRKLLPDRVYTKASLIIYVGATFDNLTIALAISSSDEYEPFVPNKPSLEYESPVQSVGQNVNLCNAPYTEKNKFTRTASKDDDYIMSDYFVHLIKGHTYTVSFESDGVSGGTAGTDTVEFYLAKDKQYTNCIVLQSSKVRTVICEETGDYYLRFDVNKNGATHSFWNIKVEEGTVATAYSPPNQGSVSITKCNKNMFCSEMFNDNTKGFDVTLRTMPGTNKVILNGSTSETKGFTLKTKELPLSMFKIGTKYSLSIDNKDVNFAFEIYENNSSSASHWLSSMTMEKSYTKIVLYLQVNSGKILNFDNKIVSLQLEEGEKTDIVEYQSETKVLPIQKEMCKIEDYADEFIKQNGKWYEKHYTKRKIFDGTEGFIKIDITKNNIYQYRTPVNIIPDASITPDPFPLTNNSYCNYFKKDSNVNTYSREGFSFITNKQVIFDTKYTTLEEFTTKLKELYNSGKPLYIDYLLAEPELIECTEEQSKILDELENWSTYKNITNMYNDSIAILKANYTKDLETLLNKLTAVQTASTPVQEEPSYEEPSYEEPSIEPSLEKEVEETENSKVEGGEEE